jgi:hypothetical protein
MNAVVIEVFNLVDVFEGGIGVLPWPVGDTDVRCPPVGMRVCQVGLCRYFWPVQGCGASPVDRGPVERERPAWYGSISPFGDALHGL